jgi:hypothetical protein
MPAKSLIQRSWLAAPNEQDRRALLEYTRGVLYSLSFDREGQARPVHVSRIRNAFEDLGVPSLYRVGLQLLRLLREAESLFGGYWLLAPFRVVLAKSGQIFIGAVPSASGHLGPVSEKGLARLITDETAARFPRQSIEGWMGGPVSSSAQYVREFVSAHQQHAAPAIDSPEIEYLHLIVRGVAARRALWSRTPFALLFNEQIGICRLADHGIYRYFSADIRRSTVNAEMTLQHSLPRLVFAIAKLNGNPFRVDIRESGSTHLIRVSERLPNEEFRLALLLANEINRQGVTTEYGIESELAPMLLDKLEDMGCQLERQQ